MGFGRGKGFTSKVRTEMTKYLVKSGGGKAALALAELSPIYDIGYGGGKAALALTELSPTYTAETFVPGYDEQQTQSNADISIKGTNAPTCGQRLTISDRTVTLLAFKIGKFGNPTGDIYFRIRKVSDKSLIASKLWGASGDMPEAIDWREAVLDTPAYVNEEARILIEYSGYDDDNYLISRLQTSDVKADEMWTRGEVATPVDMATWDFVYGYNYT